MVGQQRQVNKVSFREIFLHIHLKDEKFHTLAERGGAVILPFSSFCFGGGGGAEPPPTSWTKRGDKTFIFSSNLADKKLLENNFQIV